jgi:anti-sigma factor RsiW
MTKTRSKPPFDSRKGGLSCGEIAEGNLTDRYLRHELSPRERAAFEVHYFSCDRCFEDLTIDIAVSADLGKAPLSAGGPRTGPRRDKRRTR